jgi:hypothetical protein
MSRAFDRRYGRYVKEPTAMIRLQLLRDKGVVVVTPDGKLQASDFDRVAAQVDPIIEAKGKLNGVMIYTENFPGWADFAALVTHIRFVRDHHREVRRVAVVSDSNFLRIIPAVARHFVAAEVRHFPVAEKESALTWLQGPP